MRRPTLTYANVMSTLGVFIALGGTGYAVAKPPKNSVGTAELRDAGVTAAKLAPGVAVSGPRGPRGAQGPEGLAGANGVNGARGPSDAWFAGGGDIALSGSANVRTVLAKVTVPAGSYVIEAQTYASSGSQAGAIVTCGITVNGEEVAGQSGIVGNGAGSGRVLPYSLFTVKTFAAQSLVAFDCRTDQSLSPAVGVGQARLVATQVAATH